MSSSILKAQKKKRVDCEGDNIDPSYRNAINSSASEEIPDIGPNKLNKASNVKTPRQEDVGKRIATFRHGIHFKRNSVPENQTFHALFTNS